MICGSFSIAYKKKHYHVTNRYLVENIILTGQRRPISIMESTYQQLISPFSIHRSYKIEKRP
jgi:hypothetical protein